MLFMRLIFLFSTPELEDLLGVVLLFFSHFVSLAKIILSVYINIDVIFAHARKITGACGWQKLFRAGQILYSRTNLQRDFRQVSILGFPLNFDSEALSWYSNFPPGFIIKFSRIYVKRQSFEVREFSVIFVLIAFCQP